MKATDLNQNTVWFRVLDIDGTEVARTVLASDAAILVSRLSSGARIKYGRQIVWIEGLEGFSGAEDIRAANQMWATIQRKGR